MSFFKFQMVLISGCTDKEFARPQSNENVETAYFTWKTGFG